MKLLNQHDKRLHFFVGIPLGFISIILALAAGLYKEIKDQKDYGGFDGYDLLATVFGGLVGQIVSILIFLIIIL